MAMDHGDNYEWLMRDLPPIRRPHPGGCVFRGVGYAAEIQWPGVQIRDTSFVHQYETKMLVPLEFDYNQGRVITSLDIFRDEGLIARFNGEDLRVKISGYELHERMTYQEMFRRMELGTVFLGTFPVRVDFLHLGSNIYFLDPPLKRREVVPNHLVTFVGHGKKSGRPFLLFPNHRSPSQIGRVYFTEVYQVPHVPHFKLISVNAGAPPAPPPPPPPPLGPAQGPSQGQPPSGSRGRSHPYDRARLQQPRGPRQGPVPARQRQSSGRARCIMDYAVPECLVAAAEREGMNHTPYEYIVCRKRVQRSCSDHFRRRCRGIGLGFGFRMVAPDRNFNKLTVDYIVPDCKKSNSRVILLDCNETLMPQTTAKESTLVCHQRNLCSEFGLMQMAEPVMNPYPEATDGLYIETKDSSMVWHHQDADPGCRSAQAKEMLDHLEAVLADELVFVKSGQHIVEVKPQIAGMTTARMIYGMTVARTVAFSLRRASNRLKARRKAAPVAKAAETAVCRNLGIIQNGEEVTEQAMTEFARRFHGQVPDHVLAVMGALLKVGTPEDEELDMALLSHDGAAALDLEEDAQADAE